MEYALIYIIAALGISIVLNIILKKFGISQIIGYILTGTFVAYVFDLREAGHSHELELIGEFGIVFLMFTIGLEISLEKMGTMKKEIFTNGLLQVGLSSFVLYCGAHYLFHLDAISALIIALAFSLSSTAVVLSYLKASKEIYTPYGHNATGILIFQDIAVIPMLILLGFLTSEANEAVTTILLHTTVSAFVVIAFLFVIGKRIVAWLLHFSASSELDELFMGSVLFIVMAASLFASAMGFTYSLGAFVAGMIIAETKYHHKVEADIAPFKDLLLGTFFVVVGMKIDLGIFYENIVLILAIFVVVFVVKTVVLFLFLQLWNNKATAMKTALSLSQVGEFSFVIFAVATMGGVMEGTLAQILVLVVIVSMMVTPFFIPHINELVEKMMGEKDVEASDLSSLRGRENHIIVCGYSVVGKFVAQHLEELGAPFIVVDNSNKHVKEALQDGLEAYLGDASKSSILQALHIEKSAAVLVTLDNIDKKRLICEAVVQHATECNLIVKVVSLEEKQKLEDLPITSIVDGKVEVARVLVERMLSCQLHYNK